MCFMNEVNDCMQQGPSIISKNKTTLSHRLSAAHCQSSLTLLSFLNAEARIRAAF